MFTCTQVWNNTFSVSNLHPNICGEIFENKLSLCRPPEYVQFEKRFTLVNIQFSVIDGRYNSYNFIAISAARYLAIAGLFEYLYLALHKNIVVSIALRKSTMNCICLLCWNTLGNLFHRCLLFLVMILFVKRTCHYRFFGL